MTDENPHDVEGRMAQFFDECAAQGLMAEFDEAERAKLDGFLRRWAIEPGMRVLEPGCGGGRLTAVLAEATGAEGEVVACDLSRAMIALARERGLPPHVQIRQQPISFIDRPDGWFNRIICLNVFPHFADPAMILGHMSRLLSPEGGALWINHFEGRNSLNEFHRHAGEVVSRHELPTAEAMDRLMADAGLKVVELEDVSGSYQLKAVKA